MPEPIPENLTQLCDACKSGKFDLGVAVDPDSDRCVLIDETGAPLVEEYTLALSVYHALKNCGVKEPVCKNISTTRAVDDICALFNVKCIGTAIGEVNVAMGMVENNSIIGGEGNGGVMFKPCHIGRDALVAVALVLTLMTKEKKKISEIKAGLPQWRISKSKIQLKEGIDVPQMIKVWKENLIKEYGNDIKMNEIDGLRVDTKDWWVHVRKSNTEPVIRVIGEGHTQEEGDAVCKKVFDQFQQLMK